MAVDTLAYAKALETAGVDRAAAEAQATALAQHVLPDLVTGTDVANLATKVDIAELKTGMAELKYDLSWRFFGMTLGIVGLMNAILFALLRVVH